MLTTETPSTAQLLRRPLQPRKQFFRKRSRSMNSIKHLNIGLAKILNMQLELFSQCTNIYNKASWISSTLGGFCQQILIFLLYYTVDFQKLNMSYIDYNNKLVIFISIN